MNASEMLAADRGRRLAAAVAQDRLEVAYQPIVSLRDGSVFGFEALSRWTDPVDGIVPPDIFIPMAERVGLIDALGLCVLRRAARMIAALNTSRPDRPACRVTVNVSPLQLADPGFPQQVQAVLAESSLVPELLCLEITEGALVSDEGQHQALQRLHELGVRLAIDDFGTGFSSLSYLASLPVHTVKVDRSFVTAVHDLDRRAMLLNGVIGLAHSLSLATVAEGVETAEQLDLLRQIECDLAQGYLLARPVPEGDLRAMLPEIEAHCLRTVAHDPGPSELTPRRMRPPTVVVVDDDPISLQLSRYLLTAHNQYRVLTASNADEFDSILRHEQPDLVLLDVQLPGRSGHDVAQGLRADPRTATVPVLAITAFPEQLQQQGLGGFSGLLAKPWDPEQFLHRVQAALAGRPRAALPAEARDLPAGFDEAAADILAFLHAQLGFATWMIAQADGPNCRPRAVHGAGFADRPGAAPTGGPAQTTTRWEDTICVRMVRAEGPGFAPDLSAVPAYAAAPVAASLGIQAYLGVPLYAGGELFGALCALDPSPQPSSGAAAMPLVELLGRTLTTILSAGRAPHPAARRPLRARARTHLHAAGTG